MLISLSHEAILDGVSAPVVTAKGPHINGIETRIWIETGIKTAEFSSGFISAYTLRYRHSRAVHCCLLLTAAPCWCGCRHGFSGY